MLQPKVLKLKTIHKAPFTPIKIDLNATLHFIVMTTGTQQRGTITTQGKLYIGNEAV